MKLYGYWRSSASYRVRIALNLKGVDVEHVPVNLRTAEHREAGYAAINPQMMVPTLELETGDRISQSISIIEFLEEMFPTPALLPVDPVLRAQVRAAAAVIASDTAPIQNLRVLNYVKREFEQDQDGAIAWARHWIASAFETLERIASKVESPFVLTDEPSLVECCLVPQLFNARRFGLPLDAYPVLTAIEARCLMLPAFEKARPENQTDAPKS